MVIFFVPQLGRDGRELSENFAESRLRCPSSGGYESAEGCWAKSSHFDPILPIPGRRSGCTPSVITIRKPQSSLGKSTTMRIAYMNTDEVNGALAEQIAVACGAVVRTVLPKDPAPGGQFDAILYNLDDVPREERSVLLEELRLGKPHSPTAVHGYDLTDEQVRTLRQNGVAAARRLSAGPGSQSVQGGARAPRECPARGVRVTWIRSGRSELTDFGLRLPDPLRFNSRFMSVSLRGRVPQGTRRHDNGRDQDQTDRRSGAAGMVREPAAEALCAVPGVSRFERP